MNEKDLVSDIRYSYGDELKGKKILLIVTGSVAAYKIPDLIRLLIRHGGDVYVLPSIESLKYVALDTLKWSSGGKVIDRFSYRAEHINLIKNMDLVAVIPATANIIAKAANPAAPIANPLPIAAVVFPTSSNPSVISLVSAPKPAISAMPPALSATGP